MPDEQRARIAALVRAGATRAEIAAITGETYGRVCWAIRDTGVRVPGAYGQRVNIAGVLAAARVEPNHSEIARRYAISREYVRRIVREYEEATGEKLPRLKYGNFPAYMP